jgi:hypothetical protein
MEIHMRCPICENLQSAFETKRQEYIESGSLAYYRVSKKFAAYKNVEMERALSELQEHQAGCVSAANLTGTLPAEVLRRPQYQKERRSAAVGAAA